MTETIGENGRPLGAASGGDVGFWDRLGTDEGGMPVHLPIGVSERGQGPEDDSAAYTFTCWCGDVECPLSLALGHAWASGRRDISPEVCSCPEGPYIGTQPFGEPVRCERCGCVLPPAKPLERA